MCLDLNENINNKYVFRAKLFSKLTKIVIFSGEASVALKEAGLPDVLLKLLKKEDSAPELLCNTLALVRALGTKGTQFTDCRVLLFVCPLDQR